ncbi:MAG: hypothetical protein ACFFFB_13930 [Candidatus Heimdallarchaeota archaeon]
MPYCINCGQEISEEDFLYFKGECIDCQYGVEMDYGLKLTSCFFIGFFGLIFLISSSLMIITFILDGVYLSRIITSSQFLVMVIYHGISIIMIVLAIKRFRAIQYRRRFLV